MDPYTDRTHRIDGEPRPIASIPIDRQTIAITIGALAVLWALAKMGLMGGAQPDPQWLPPAPAPAHVERSYNRTCIGWCPAGPNGW